MRYSVKVHFVPGLSVPETPFFLQSDLGITDPDHPFGQWSVLVTPSGGGHLLKAISAYAPTGHLRTGSVVGLFRGTSSLGSATVLGIED